MLKLLPIQALAAAVTELHKLTLQGGSALWTEIKACVRKYHSVSYGFWETKLREPQKKSQGYDG